MESTPIQNLAFDCNQHINDEYIDLGLFVKIHNIQVLVERMRAAIKCGMYIKLDTMNVQNSNR